MGSDYVLHIAVKIKPHNFYCPEFAAMITEKEKGFVHSHGHCNGKCELFLPACVFNTDLAVAHTIAHPDPSGFSDVPQFAGKTTLNKQVSSAREQLRREGIIAQWYVERDGQNATYTPDWEARHVASDTTHRIVKRDTPPQTRHTQSHSRHSVAQARHTL